MFTHINTDVSNNCMSTPKQTHNTYDYSWAVHTNQPFVFLTKLLTSWRKKMDFIAVRIMLKL